MEGPAPVYFKEPRLNVGAFAAYLHDFVRDSCPRSVGGSLSVGWERVAGVHVVGQFYFGRRIFAFPSHVE